VIVMHRLVAAMRRSAALRSVRDGVGHPACLLCAGGSESLICTACRDELPWNCCACRRCARPLPSETMTLCRPCQRRAPPFEAAIAAFRYAAPVDQAIQGLKYHADFLAARWLGEALAEAVVARSMSPADLLLPVPLHHGRLRQRGYNQSLELARHTGRQLQIELRPLAARRLRATEDQIGKTAHERRRNLRGAFAVDRTVQARHVALIDDVMTTGSTLAELARACRRAGAASVQVWVVARVE
jgi:ComF family protein